MAPARCQQTVNPLDSVTCTQITTMVPDTRVHHGQPAFLSYIELHVTIQSQDILYSVNILSKNLILV
jgi:hypothetical protein